MPEEAVAMSDLGDMIREVREMRQMSQRELSVRAGIASSTVSFIERGLTERPDPDTLMALAEALGIDPHSLLEKAGIIPQDDAPPVPPELADLIADVEALRDTPLYHQTLRLLRETLMLALYKLDPPPESEDRDEPE